MRMRLDSPSSCVQEIGVIARYSPLFSPNPIRKTFCDTFGNQ